MNSLVDYSVNDLESNMEIRTERLDPIVSSKYRYVFRIDSSSYIDRNSMLVFKPKTTVAASGNLRLNCFNGGLGAIKNVELQVGDNSIQKISGVNRWSTLNHVASRSPQVQNKKLSHYLQNSLKFLVRNDGGLASSEVVGAIQPDPSTSGINYGRPDTGAQAAINSQALTQNAADNQSVGIPLGMLLPMLNDRDLPAFLFTNYKVHLIIEFESDSGKFANDITQFNYGAGERLAAAANSVEFEEVELLLDELILPSRVQNAVLEETLKEGGYQIAFTNVATVKKTIAAATANQKQSLEHRLNLTNQEVHYIQFLRQLPDAKSDKVLLGQRCDGQSINELQWNVNGVDIYPNPVTNPIELYNNVTYTLGRDLQVVKPMYVKDPATCSSLLSPPDLGLLGKYQPLCLDLRNGEPTLRGGGRYIGEYPIRAIQSRTPVADTDCTWFNANNFQICQAENGAIDCDYFIGATRIMNVKTMPGGAMNVVVSNM